MEVKVLIYGYVYEILTHASKYLRKNIHINTPTG
jgi:hypothetical protein